MTTHRLTLLVALSLVLLAASAGAQQIVQSRGYDSRVDYVELGLYGPWDDRNYELTQDDIALLADNELERRPRVALFYRIEMLKERPVLRDPARRYPRSALNKFFGRYGGFLVEGKLYRHVEVEGHRIRVDPDKGIDKEDFDSQGQKAFVKLNGWNVKTLRLGAETAVKLKPGSSTIAIAGVNDPSFGQSMLFSTTGGRLWTPAAGAAPLPGSCCDPTVDWSSDGSKAYAATLQGAAGDVRVYRSGNDGQTWDDLPGNGRTELGESGADKEYLHVDKHPGSPFVDRVYLCWHTDNVQRLGFSADQAETFTTKSIATNDRQIGIGCDLTTDKDGRLFYFWPTFNSRRILVRRSVDGGEGFQKTRQVAKTQAAFDYPIPVMHQRSAFVYVTAEADLSDGPFANSLYAAWSDTYDRDGFLAAQNHSRVRVAFSRDGGLTWTVRSPHPTGDGDTVDRFHPWLAVDPEGFVHLIYYDTERSANRRGADVIHAISQDGGDRWTTRRVTTDVAARVNDGFQFGDYNGLDATGVRLLATWTGTEGGEAIGLAGRRNN